MLKDYLIYYTKGNIIKGMIIYSLGDTIATLLTTGFDIYRLIGIIVIGGFLYSLEIPPYFIWIFNTVPDNTRFIDKCKRAILSMLFFNPLWIARHILFLHIASGNFDSINMSLLTIGFWSFTYNIPISFVGNMIIQNYIPLQHKYIASSVFSGLLAIYYSLSEVLFK